MKIFFKLIGIIVLVTIIGFSFAACDGGDDGDGNGNGNGNQGTAPTITTAPLPNGTVGTAYSQTLTATGDTPITWSIETGTLPTGLSLAETTGVISGTPTTSGIFNFTVKATNAAGNGTKQLSITITTTEGGIAPIITTTTLSGGTVGTAYSQTLTASGDTPITWSIETGTLPTGLSLAETTGVISGTPTTAETFNFTVKATNATGNHTKSLSLTIVSPVFLTVTFIESDGWHYYQYQDANKSFDISDLLEKNQVYIFTYSFSSNKDINTYSGVFFVDQTSGTWVTDWTMWVSNIKANTKYSGKVVLIPNEDANGRNPENIFLNLGLGEQINDSPATLSFYDFSLEKVYKEPEGLEKWTISGKEFKISDKTRTVAELLNPFEGKNDVLHIRTAYNSGDHGGFVIQYDLNSYRGKTIEIVMSMDVYLKSPSRIVWQINSPNNPFYPVVCGDHDTALTANTWHSLTGSYTYTVPNTDSGDDKGKQLYLSGQQIDGAEAYFANATITITEK